jgi:hypothetical protein
MAHYTPPYLCVSPNYERPAFSPCDPKPSRGARILAKEEADARDLKIEREAKGEAKKRDGRCRWPEKHKCRGGDLEAAHIEDASTGGLMEPANLVTLCPWYHRRGPESIHGKQIKVEKETEHGAIGPLSFWRQTGEFDELGQPTYYLVARETAPFVYERD